MGLLTELLLRFFNACKLRNPKLMLAVVFVLACIKLAVDDGYAASLIGSDVPDGVASAIDWILLTLASVVGVHSENAVQAIDKGVPPNKAIKR